MIIIYMNLLSYSQYKENTKNRQNKTLNRKTLFFLVEYIIKNKLNKYLKKLYLNF